MIGYVTIGTNDLDRALGGGLVFDRPDDTSSPTQATARAQTP